MSTEFTVPDLMKLAEVAGYDPTTDEWKACQPYPGLSCWPTGLRKPWYWRPHTDEAQALEVIEGLDPELVKMERDKKPKPQKPSFCVEINRGECAYAPELSTAICRAVLAVLQEKS